MDDSVNLMLRIQPYPFTTRIQIKISTNYGDISDGYDIPPHVDDQLGVIIQKSYERLNKKLYDAHVERGGLFMGEDGCKKWMDDNGRTIIEESHFSERFNREE